HQLGKERVAMPMPNSPRTSQPAAARTLAVPGANARRQCQAPMPGADARRRCQAPMPDRRRRTRRRARVRPPAPPRGSGAAAKALGLPCAASNPSVAKEQSMRERLHFLLLNIGHFLDHLFTLIFATVAALALYRQWNLGYAELIKYATPGFFAFGLFALPAG